MRRSLWLILAIALQPILSAWSGSNCGTCAKSCLDRPTAAAAEPSCCGEPAEPDGSGCSSSCNAESSQADDQPPPCATRCDIFKDPLCTICNILCRTLCEQGPTYSITPGPRSKAPAPTRSAAALLAAVTYPRPADIYPDADAHPARALSPPTRRALLCIRVI